MFAMTMHLMGPVEWLTKQLESTKSASRRATLLRKLALSHDPGVIPTLVPYLGGEPRVSRAAVVGILHFGEDARGPMLDVLADPTRKESHPGALRVLVALVRAGVTAGD
jgi:hypothetical protein